MLSLNHCSKARSLVVVLLIAGLFSIAAPAAAASDRHPDSDKAASRESSNSQKGLALPKEGLPRTRSKPAGNSYVYNGAVTAAPEANASRPRSVARLRESVNAATAHPIPLPPQKSPGVISTAQ